MHRCPYCGKLIEEDDEYCRFCGQPLVLQKFICPICGELLYTSMQTCPGCGHKLKELMLIDRMYEKNSIFSFIKKRRNILLIFFFLLTCAIGLYIYSSYKNTYIYTANAAKCIKELNYQNESLANAFSTKNLTKNDKQVLYKKIVSTRKKIMDINEEFSKLHTPKQYSAATDKMKKILTDEISLLDHMEEVIKEPLRQRGIQDLAEIRENTADIKKTASQLSFTGKKVILGTDFTAIPDNLAVWINNLVYEYEEKTKNLSDRTRFFQKMDKYIRQYEITKDSLPDILNNLRKGGYTWSEYFSELDNAALERKNIYDSVAGINAVVSDDKALLQSFVAVLNDSRRYVELVRMAALMEFESNSYQQAETYYGKAEAMHQREISSYKYFLKKYNTAKNKLSKLRMTLE
ncbi:zinc ribbon domain-containing protein [Pectinatus sottacetonis]|uniref:zinc ribbon domain-containing protein n=1 Tax=Pectinatus sottacetonis TaxID=1002795 RepID=UPI0018C79BEF|nr:zinc ribbon domain-containing protein [Pectinatus sottacetonis]